MTDKKLVPKVSEGSPLCGPARTFSMVPSASFIGAQAPIAYSFFSRMFPAHPHLHHAFSFSVPITPENFSLHFLPSYLLSTPFSQPLFHNEVFILFWLSLHCSCCPGGVLRFRDSVVGRGSNSSREHQDFRITWCNHLRFSMPTDPTVAPPLTPPLRSVLIHPK